MVLLKCFLTYAAYINPRIMMMTMKRFIQLSYYGAVATASCSQWRVNLARILRGGRGSSRRLGGARDGAWGGGTPPHRGNV